MITLYFLQASRSIRIAWLLELLQLDYAIAFSDRVDQKAPQAFKHASGNPLGKFPAIRDDSNDVTLYESGAIVDYLVERYDARKRLLPEDQASRSKARIWEHAAEGTFMLHALAVTYARWNFPKGVADANPGALEEMERGLSVNVQNDFRWLEEEIVASPGGFLVGDHVTVADVMMGFSAEFILERGLGVKKGQFEAVEQWLRRCTDTVEYRRAVEKSGYTLYPKSI